MIRHLLTYLLLSAASGWSVHRNQSGVRIGTRPPAYVGSNNPLRGTGVKIGVNKEKGYTRVVTTLPPPPPTPPPTQDPNIKKVLHVGLVVPFRKFDVRIYNKAMTSAINNIHRATRGPQLNAFKTFELKSIMEMKPITPSPTF